MKKLNFNLLDGHNTLVNPFQNKEGESRVTQNCDTTKIGVISKQKGYATYGNNITDSIVGLYDYTLSAGTVYWLAVAGKTLYKDVSGTWTAVDANFTTGLEMDFTTYLDTVIMTNGTDNVKDWNGTTFADLGGSPPKGKFIEVFSESIFLANLSTNKSRLQWSDTGTTETWTGTNYQDFRTNDGDEITGIKRHLNTLLVFKNNGMWKFGFNADGTTYVDEISSTVGTTDRRSIATINEWTFFLSEQGIFAYNGLLQNIGGKVQDFIDGITDRTAVVGIADQNFYYLYIGTSNGVTNCLLIYNYLQNKWSYKNMPDVIKTMAVMTTSGGTRTIKFGNNAGQVYTLNSGYSDNATDITMDYQTPPIHFNKPDELKELHAITLFSKNETYQPISIYYSLDYGDWEFLGDIVKSVNIMIFPSRKNLCYHTRLRFKESSSSQAKEIYGYAIDYEVSDKESKK